MRRRIILIVLAGSLFIGLLFIVKEIATSVIPRLSTSQNQPSPEQFELLTDDATETLPLTKEVLLSSPLVIFGKGTVAPFTPAEVVAETNRQRVEAGLPQLTSNTTLEDMAKAKVQDMFENQYFEHTSPITGKGPDGLAKDAGYAYVSIGENLALGNFGDEGALVDAWMQSPGHRANILRPQFEEIGIAVGRGTYEGRQVLIAVQEFGRPLSSCPFVESSIKSSIDSDRVTLTTLGSTLKDMKAQIDASSTQSISQDAYANQIASYNTQVNAYNALVASIKQKTTTYNSEVQAFNYCLKNSI